MTTRMSKARWTTITYASVIGKRSSSASETSTSHFGKTCSSSPLLIWAMTIKIKAGVRDTVVPTNSRRDRRFASGETAVSDLKKILAKKLPIAVKPNQDDMEPNLSQNTAKRETVA